jgi:EAL domain-containing protein (putative c-di-GMP-specific phosphodiesterase class I)
MDVVAEGIETPDQAAYLRSLDCEYGQGHLFSRPLPAESVAAVIGASRPSS